MRGLTNLALLALLALLGCSSPAAADFVAAQGRFADGTPLELQLAATTRSTASLQPALGSVRALDAAASGPESLVGLRLEWTAIQAGGVYPSAPGGPVVFYVERQRPDGGALDVQASVVDGCTITFTSAGPITTGTLANLALVRRDPAGNPQTLLTVDSGSFRATTP